MHYDSPGAMVPRGEQLEPRQSPKTQRRYLSIDILRAVAILLMIQVHFGEHWSEDIASPKYLADLSENLGHVPAPLFTLLSGLSYWLWLGVQKRSGHSTDEIIKYSLRRGLFVFALGIAVNVFIFLPDNTFNWDILTLIGASAIILIWVRNSRPSILIAICILILLVSPPLRDLSNYESHWVDEEFSYETNLDEVLLGFVLNGYFPLLPWLVYPLAGFALGQIFYRDEEEVSLPLILPLLGTLMIALALLGGLFQSQVPAWAAKYYAQAWSERIYPATTVFVLGSLGGILISLWVMSRAIDLNRRVTGTGPVLTFFRRYGYFALTAYVVHLALTVWPMWIAAWWQQKTPTTFYWGKFLSLQTALTSAVIFIVVFYLCLIFLDRHKKYSLEYLLRWICH